MNKSTAGAATAAFAARFPRVFLAPVRNFLSFVQISTASMRPTSALHRRCNVVLQPHLSASSSARESAPAAGCPSSSSFRPVTLHSNDEGGPASCKRAHSRAAGSGKEDGEQVAESEKGANREDVSVQCPLPQRETQGTVRDFRPGENMPRDKERPLTKTTSATAPSWLFASWVLERVTVAFLRHRWNSSSTLCCRANE